MVFFTTTFECFQKYTNLLKENNIFEKKYIKHNNEMIEKEGKRKIIKNKMEKWNE